jgi:hypothetical protein
LNEYSFIKGVRITTDTSALANYNYITYQATKKLSFLSENITRAIVTSEN